MGLLLAIACLGVGCGGGGDAAEATASISKAQLLEKGNSICLKGSREMEANEARIHAEHRPAETPQAATEAILPVRKKELRLLRGLGVPMQGAAQWEEMLAKMESGIKRAEREPHSLVGAEDGYAFYKAYLIGIDYGLTDCWLG